ncbi:hypothetical protein RM572_28060 [Streptomyces sp. DSM 42041]|uniref:Uncharacterized protein n=1 Tax=Streptomyces hazeniae TaxID=3075538 RepID=A0ABU2P2D1_9ACTN|nr:hypothetical protein [Streptomyces sp. DSM 42041]MDT0382613.1 hypothetical protein [Streptomyces sp. DSM 42041]
MMNDVESFINVELADADADGSIHETTGPVLTLAAFAAGAGAAAAVVTAYEAGADG